MLRKHTTITHKLIPLFIYTALDYLGAMCEPSQEERTAAFVHSVEKSIGTYISLLGFGPGDLQIRESWPTRVEKIYA